jgi:predicted  nucleic acid-binding Zn-ribbon protein
MSTETAVQVSKEEEMATMMARIVGFLQDATQLPTLRKELEAVRAECESLKREKAELEVEIQLERDERARHANRSHEQATEINKLNSRLTSLQHKFDTINGVVQAAMEEIGRDRPKTEGGRAQVEPEQWNPTSPLRSVSY